MKRIISLVLVLMMVLSLAPAAHAYSAPAQSSNIDDHFYINVGRWTDPIKSTLAAEDGGYTRVEYIDDRVVVERYDADLKFVSGMELAEELPVYGGVYIGADYNFLVTGQNNVEEDDSKEVFRITRYDKDWNRLDHASLFGANTIYPFDAGCVRFDRSGNILYIRTCHEMYTTEDGLNHQANVFIALRVSDMTITDSFTDILNRDYGYISHSFNQFVRVDGETLLAVDHGDALPRSIVLINYGEKAGEEEFFGKVTYVNAFPIAEATDHYNDTGVSVGGFECSSSHYLIAGSSCPQDGSVDQKTGHRNIFVTATPKDDFTDEATAIHWLTDYEASDGVTVSPPHLVKLSEDRLMLTWTEDGDLKYCFVGGNGQLIGEIYDAEGDLSDCVPIVDGDRILWYVTSWSVPVFHSLSTALPHTHSYTAVVTDPTCIEQGYTTHTCTECGDSYVDTYTEALGHGWCDWYTVKEVTCTDPGYEQRDCTRCNVHQTRKVSAPGHDWDGLRCDRCGSTRKTPFDDVEPDSFYETPVAWAVEKGITNGISATEFGPTQACNRAQVVTFLWRACGSPEPAVMEHPFLDVEKGSFYEKAVIWAVESRITNGLDATHFGPTTPCNRAQVVTFLWRTMDKPESNAANPFTDVNAGDFYYEAVLWAVEKNITNGLSTTEFGVNSICNRAQIVTFLYRAFADSDIPTVPTPSEPAPTDPDPTDPEQPTNPGLDVPPSDPDGEEYILNLSTKKFHKSSCYSVDQIAAENYHEFIGFREDLIEYGYSPCGRCKP